MREEKVFFRAAGRLYIEEKVFLQQSARSLSGRQCVLSIARIREPAMPEDLAQIETAVKTYLDGLYEGDAEKLASVFHPTSCLTYEEAGKLIVLPREQWLGLVRGRPSPKSRDLARHDEILQIDRASPTMAFVKLKCAIPPRFFTDYLSLLKIDGKWQVAQKVYATETR
jgi:hypothetical protein